MGWSCGEFRELFFLKTGETRAIKYLIYTKGLGVSPATKALGARMQGERKRQEWRSSVRHGPGCAKGNLGEFMLTREGVGWGGSPAQMERNQSIARVLKFYRLGEMSLQ